MFRKNDTVKVKPNIIIGEVKNIRMDDSGGIFYFVEWVDAEGLLHSRWFKETELETN